MSPSNMRLSSQSTIRLEPLRRWNLPNITEIWERRELLQFLFWRDLHVRYKQAVLGSAWAIITPMLFMAVFTLFFGVIFQTPSEGVPRPVFIFAGVLTWLFFSEAFTSASSSLVKDKHLLAKLFFPRLIIPLSSVLTPLVDYGLGLIALLAMMGIYGMPVRSSIALVPVFAVVVVFIALSVGIWFSALNLEFNDFRHLTPLLVTLWFYATPIFYPVSSIPVEWQPLYRLNPMVGVVEGVRWALFGTTAPELGSFLLALVPFAVFLLVGSAYFVHTQWRFSEMV